MSTGCITPRKNKNPTHNSPTSGSSPSSGSSLGSGSRMPSGSSGSRRSGWLGGRGSAGCTAAVIMYQQVPLKKIIPSRSYRNKA